MVEVSRPVSARPETVTLVDAFTHLYRMAAPPSHDVAARWVKEAEQVASGPVSGRMIRAWLGGAVPKKIEVFLVVVEHLHQRAEARVSRLPEKQLPPYDRSYWISLHQQAKGVSSPRRTSPPSAVAVATTTTVGPRSPAGQATGPPPVVAEDVAPAEYVRSQIRRLATALRDCPVLAADETARTRFAADVGAAPYEVADLMAFLEGEISAGRTERLLQALQRQAVSVTAQLEVALVRDCWIRQQWVVTPLRALQHATCQQVRQAHYGVLPDGPDVSTLAEALDAAGAYGRRGDPDAPLYRLVASLEHLTGHQVPETWFELDADQLSGVRSRAGHRLGHTPSHLVIDIRTALGGRGQIRWPDVVAGHLLHLGNWSRDDAPCPERTLASVQAGVRGLIEKLVYQRGIATITVGFLLPRAAHLYAPESWSLEDVEALKGESAHDASAIGDRHPVVLHSRERLFPSRSSYPFALWRERVQAFHGHLVHAPPDVVWVEQDDCDRPEALSARIDRVLAGDVAACLGWGFALGQGTISSGQDPVMACVLAGAPYVLWLEHEPDDWNQVRKHVGAAVRGGTFDESMHRLYRARRGRAGQLHDRLRILWDCPQLLPPIGTLKPQEANVRPDVDLTGKKGAGHE